MVTQRQYETEAFETADKKYDLMGTLTDSDGNPLSQVDLAIKCENDGTEYSATTDSDGKFLIENVGPGKYTVTTSSDDYEKTSGEHQVGESSDDDNSSDSSEAKSDDSDESQDETETQAKSDESSEDSEEESSDSDEDDSEK